MCAESGRDNEHEMVLIIAPEIRLLECFNLYFDTGWQIE